VSLNTVAAISPQGFAGSLYCKVTLPMVILTPTKLYRSPIVTIGVQSDVRVETVKT